MKNTDFQPIKTLRRKKLVETEVEKTYRNTKQLIESREQKANQACIALLFYGVKTGSLLRYISGRFVPLALFTNVQLKGNQGWHMLIAFTGRWL